MPQSLTHEQGQCTKFSTFFTTTRLTMRTTPLIMAITSEKALKGMPTHLWSDSDLPAPDIRDVLTQLAHFFDQLGYTKTFSALLKEANKDGHSLDIAEWERGINDIGVSHALMGMWEAWHVQKKRYPRLPNGEDAEESSSDDGTSSESEDEEDEETEGKKAGLVDDEAESTSDDSSSEEDSSDEEAATGIKRKRIMTPESSDPSDEQSEPDSDRSSADEDDARPAKRAKVSSDDVDTGSQSDSSSASDTDAEGGISADSDSSSESDSSDASSSGSDSDSSASSDSESDSSPSPPTAKRSKSTVQKLKKERTGSATSSSATLNAQSPPPPPKQTKKDKQKKPAVTKTTKDELLVPAPAVEAEEDPTAGMHPDRLKRLPATQENVNNLKKSNVPFSRIPADTKVDPRFASNEYVSYEYADRAFKDLSVTKGKGFTKEKNKKKRGTSTTPNTQVGLDSSNTRQHSDTHLDSFSSDTSSSEDSDSDAAGLFGLDNPGFKDDTWDFMTGCGFDPMSGRWG